MDEPMPALPSPSKPPSDRWNTAMSEGSSDNDLPTSTSANPEAAVAGNENNNNKVHTISTDEAKSIEGGEASSSSSGSEDLLSGGDDLFPTLESTTALAANNNGNNATTTESSLEQMQIVPSSPPRKVAASSNVANLFANKVGPSTSIGDTANPAEDDNETTSNEKISDNNSNNNNTTTTTTTVKRKRATGLGNLGNTCFMNSTLQCLAHTLPLREYFLSGKFEVDLNTDNPLGTGGELAREFANLLSQMWLMQSTTSSNLSSSFTSSTEGGGIGNSSSNIVSSSRIYSPSTFDSNLSSITYPRSFKHTLGKHAEQFIGYDQHDSQELAIYLLDALHEDTNRVRKKPYVDKPEQGEDESDTVASAKAWDVHLQRDNSRILENFMGQVKSRVSCPKDGCGRVSTTFDPSMYLSVPIPGSMDRSMKIVFVPLEAGVTIAELTVTLCKNSTVGVLRSKVVALARECYGFSEEELMEEDVQFADIFQQKVWSAYKKDYAIDGIKDSDVTVAYQLYSRKKCVKEFEEYKKGEEECRAKLEEEDRKKELEAAAASPTRTSPIIAAPSSPTATTLDDTTKAKLDMDNKWESALENFLQQPMSLYRLMNPARSKNEERMDFYRKLMTFIQKCKKCSDATPPPVEDDGEEKKSNEDDGDVVMNGNNNHAGDDGEDNKSSTSTKSSGKSAAATTPSRAKNNAGDDDSNTQTLEEVSFSSSQFRNVCTPHDLALLQYCASKLLQKIVGLNKSSNSKGKKLEDLDENGILVQIKITKADSPTTTLNYGGYRNNNYGSASSPEPTWKIVSDPIVARIPSSLTVYGLREVLGKRLSPAIKTTNANHPATSSAPEMDLMRQVALVYENSDRGMRSGYHSNKSSPSLGTITKDGLVKERNTIFAKANDKKELELVANYVDEDGNIDILWPTHLNDAFDEDLLSTKEEYLTEAQKAEREASGSGEAKVSVMDCIAKYCEMEQLGESDEWYCNRCKEHVRAWKQFHLYRTPPILIIHLKRFHFSQTTHRRDKIDTLIDFPLNDFDLRDIVKHSETGEGGGQEPIYDCYAVSNHFGGLGGGHYTAYARGEDGTWSNFDDSRVTSGVDESEVVSSAAYCLYYKRKDVVFDSKEDDAVMTREDDVEGNQDQEAMMPVSPGPCIEMDVDNSNLGSDEGTAGSPTSYSTPIGSDTEDIFEGEQALGIPSQDDGKMMFDLQ